MGSPQDPSAPPSPYTPPPAPGPDMNALSPPINTPGLAVPSATPPAPQPAPPAPPAAPVESVPPALAQAAPDVGVPQGIAAPTYGGSMRATFPGQSETAQPLQGGYMLPQGGAVGEAQARAKSDAAENRQLKRNYDSAVEQQKMAQNAVSEVEQNQASDLGENMRHQQRELADINARGQQSQAASDKVISQRQTDWDNAVKAQKDMVFDPDKYVNNMSVGSKIFTSIAIGLSAFGNSRSIGGSGENYAMKMLNDSIQHSIDQQKEAYRRAGVNIDMAQNAYARARQSKMDDYQATLAAKQSAIDDHKMAAQVITARYDPSRIDANRQQLLAHLDTQSAQAQQEYAKTVHAEGARAAADVLNARQAGVNMALGVANYNLAAQSEADRHNQGLAELTLKQQVAEQKAAGKGPGSVAGWNGSTDNKEMQMAAAKLSGRERIMDRDIGELINYRQDYGNEAANRVAMAKAKSTATQLQVLFKDKMQLGAMSDSDKKFLEQVASDPTRIEWTPAVVEQLKHLRDQVRIDTEDEMESYGFQRDRSYKPRELIDQQPKEGGK